MCVPVCARGDYAQHPCIQRGRAEESIRCPPLVFHRLPLEAEPLAGPGACIVQLGKEPTGPGDPLPLLSLVLG